MDFNKLLNEMPTKVNKVSMDKFLLGDINVNYLTKLNHMEIKRHIHYSRPQSNCQSTDSHNKRYKNPNWHYSYNRSHVRYTKFIPLSLNDPDCVACLRKLNHSKKQFRTIECRDYSKYDYKKLARDVENYDWSPIYAITNVNVACDFIKQALSSIID